jgi:uncharacterized protein DUF4160
MSAYLSLQRIWFVDLIEVTDRPSSSALAAKRATTTIPTLLRTCLVRGTSGSENLQLPKYLRELRNLWIAHSQFYVLFAFCGIITFMSPTVFREKGYRFFFFSREESRRHVHVYCGEGEAKFWLQPHIELAKNFRLSRSQIKEIEQIIEGHYDELKRAWKEHFPD